MELGLQSAQNLIELESYPCCPAQQTVGAQYVFVECMRQEEMKGQRKRRRRLVISGRPGWSVTPGLSQSPHIFEGIAIHQPSKLVIC